MGITIKLAALAILATLAHASHPPAPFDGHPRGNPFFDGGDGEFPGGSNNPNNNNPNGSNGNGSNRNPNNNGAPFDVNTTRRALAVHGVLAALAMVILFPAGSILMRVVPGRWAMRVHATVQVVALLVFVAAAGVGIWVVQEVKIPGESGGLMSNPRANSHPIIGLVVLGAMLAQPVLGWVHHRQFVKTGGRQVWSYLHLFNGRIAIVLGMGNGGLGLWMVGAGKGLKTAYVVVAVVMATVWLGAAVRAEWKRWRSLHGRKLDGSPPESPPESPPPYK